MPPTPAEERQARLAKMQAAQKNAERRRTFLVVGIAGALAALLIGVVVVVIVRSEQEDAVVERIAKGPIGGVEDFGEQTSNHVETDVEYAQDPPVGGDHLPAPRWQDCGYYSAPVQDEAGVHSLEHGAVWITYDPELPTEQVSQLEKLAADNSYLLVSPREDLPSAVVASAWGLQLKLDDVSDERLAAFMVKYMQGEQTPEPGAPCSGGVTATL